jgi:hypothetical protein
MSIHEERRELAERYSLVRDGKIGVLADIKVPLCEKN